MRLAPQIGIFPSAGLALRQGHLEPFYGAVPCGYGFILPFKKKRLWGFLTAKNKKKFFLSERTAWAKPTFLSL